VEQAGTLTRYKKPKVLESWFLNQVLNKLVKRPWKSGGKMFQDVSRKYETLNEARSAGEKGKQIAGYDLGGTDVRRPEGGNIYFSRKVKGIETEPEFKETETGTSAPERMAARPRGKDATEQVLLSRGATYKGKPITIGQVYSKIAKNRRNRGV
jgi:hypothetical protein